MKKIYTIKMRVIEHYFILIICLAWVIAYSFLEFDEYFFLHISEGGLIELGLAIFIILGPPGITLLVERIGYSKEEFHSIIDENGYQSYLFRKKYCYVDKGKNIYYAFYHFSPYKMNFIAFSNEPFKMFEYIYLSKKPLLYLTFPLMTAVKLFFYHITKKRGWNLI